MCVILAQQASKFEGLGDTGGSGGLGWAPKKQRNHAVKIEGMDHLIANMPILTKPIDLRIWNCRYAWVAADAQSQYAGFPIRWRFFPCVMHGISNFQLYDKLAEMLYIEWKLQTTGNYTYLIYQDSVISMQFPCNFHVTSWYHMTWISSASLCLPGLVQGSDWTWYSDSTWVPLTTCISCIFRIWICHF